MKSLLFVLVAVASLAFGLQSDKSENNSKFVQFVVEQDISQEEALEIDEFMRTQPGVELSRMDHYSHKFLVVFNSFYTYDLPFFTETFEKYGLTIKCYREGVKGVDQIIHQKMDCQ